MDHSTSKAAALDKLLRNPKYSWMAPRAQDDQAPAAIEEGLNNLECVAPNRYELRDRKSSQEVKLNGRFTSIFGGSIIKKPRVKQPAKNDKVPTMADAENSGRTFPFFKLPRELRDHIYEESMVSARVRAAEYYLFSESKIYITNVPNPGLMFASKETKQEVEDTMARITSGHRVIIEYHDYEGRITRETAEQQKKAKGNTAKKLPCQAAMTKTVELLAKVEHIDVHIPASFEFWKAVKFSKDTFPLPSEDIRHALQRIVPHMPKLRAANMVLHLSNENDDLDHDFRAQRTVLMRSAAYIFNDRSSAANSHLGLLGRQDQLVPRFKVNCKILTTSPNFVSAVGSYPGIDPNGRFGDFIKNHERNRLLLEWSIRDHDWKDWASAWQGKVTTLPFCDLASHDQVEDEVLAGLLAVYEGEKTMKDLEKEFGAASGSENGFVVDPEAYADYLDSVQQIGPEEGLAASSESDSDDDSNDDSEDE